MIETVVRNQIEFDDIWLNRPGREGSNPKKRALKAYSARIKEGYTPEQILHGVVRYYNYCDQRQMIGGRYVMQMATFLGPDCHFENDWKIQQPQNRSTRDMSIQEQLMDRSWAQ